MCQRKICGKWSPPSTIWSLRMEFWHSIYTTAFLCVCVSVCARAIPDTVSIQLLLCVLPDTVSRQLEHPSRGAGLAASEPHNLPSPSLVVLELQAYEAMLSLCRNAQVQNSRTQTYAQESSPQLQLPTLWLFMPLFLPKRLRPKSKDTSMFKPNSFTHSPSCAFTIPHQTSLTTGPHIPESSGIS